MTPHAPRKLLRSSIYIVVCGWPWTMRPSFVPLGSRIQRPPEPRVRPGKRVRTGLYGNATRLRTAPDPIFGY
jgi:hypothetical protein